MMNNLLNAIVIAVLVTTFILGSAGQVSWPEPSATSGASVVAEIVPAPK